MRKTKKSLLFIDKPPHAAHDPIFVRAAPILPCLLRTSKLIYNGWMTRYGARSAQEANRVPNETFPAAKPV